jgi:hypothetical protein
VDKINITRQELYEMVWKESLTAMSKRLNIPYHHLRKVCAEMQIPVPPNGHWSKLQFGKTVEIIKLSQDYSGANEITLYPSQNDIGKPEIVTFHKKTAADLIREDTSLPLKVPKTLTNPDELILAAQKTLMEYKYSKYDDTGMVRYNGCFTIRVSRGNIGRALRFMDILIKLLRARGHILTKETTYSIHIDKVSCDFKLMEKTKKAAQEYKWGSAKFESTGQLYFEIKGFGGRIWTDGKILIEERLAVILAKIESDVNEMLECWRQNAERKRIQEENERVIRERQQRIDDERAAFKDLYQQAKRWQRARFMRDYIKAVKNSAIGRNELSEDLQNWINWANDKVDWYDPLVNKVDKLLGFYKNKKG